MEASSRALPASAPSPVALMLTVTPEVSVNRSLNDTPELVLPAHSYSEDTRVDSSYIISTTELTVLDTLDGKADYVIELDRTARHWSD